MKYSVLFTILAVLAVSADAADTPLKALLTVIFDALIRLLEVFREFLSSNYDFTQFVCDSGE